MKLFCNEFTKPTLYRRQTPHTAQTGGMGAPRGSRSQTRLPTVTLSKLCFALYLVVSCPTIPICALPRSADLSRRGLSVLHFRLRKSCLALCPRHDRPCHVGRCTAHSYTTHTHGAPQCDCPSGRPYRPMRRQPRSFLGGRKFAINPTSQEPVRHVTLTKSGLWVYGLD